MRLKPDGQDLRLDLRKRGGDAATLLLVFRLFRLGNVGCLWFFGPNIIQAYILMIGNFGGSIRHMCEKLSYYLFCLGGRVG